MLEIKNLGFRFEKDVIFKNVNFNLTNGHIYGLIGPNGSGKTTLFNCLSSYYYPNEGEIKLDGITIENNEKYLKDTILLGEDIYVKTDNIEKLAKRFAVLYGKKYDQDALDSIIKIFDFKKDYVLRKLSKGQRKLAIICIVLTMKPKRLFLDEFLDGIDVVNRRVLKNMLLDYIIENDATIIISSHTTDDIKDICDKIIIINNNTIQLQSDFEKMQELYVTYQIVSDEKIDDDLFIKLDLDVKDYKNLGNIYWISVKKEETLEEKMQEINFKDIRKIKASLEEVIYYEFTT